MFLLTSCYEGYSPLDFSVLDPHWGTWDDWVTTIDEIHARGMYFMADLTVGTMSSLIGFSGYVREQAHTFYLLSIGVNAAIHDRFLNTTAPFTLNEYEAQWLKPGYIPWNFTEYKDFEVRLLSPFSP